MDIGRTQLPNSQAAHRLDAGSYGTMGVGLGLRRRRRRRASRQADRLGLGRLGDRLLRHGDGDGLPLRAAGQDRRASTTAASGRARRSIPDNPLLNMRPNALIYGARYDKMMEAFGGKGSYVEDPKDLRDALDQAMNFQGPALVNVKTQPGFAAQAAGVPLAQLIR